MFACRREINNFTFNQPNVSSGLLESAKILNAKTLANNAEENKKTPGFFTLSPLWKKSTTLINEAGAKVIVVPTIENLINNINVSIRRLYVFDVAGDKVVSGRIVEFIGLDYSINKNLETLIKGLHSQSIKGFNGAIIQYDLNYRWVEGTQYEAGVKVANNIALSKSLKGKEVFLSKIEVGADGNTFFKEQRVLYDATKMRVLTEGDATGSMGQTSGLSEVVIPGGSSGDDDDSGGSGGGYGGSFPDPPPVGGSGGGNTPIDPNIPQLPEDPPHPTPAGNSSAPAFYVDCNSFDFRKTTTANWQEAGVTNIRLKWVWLEEGSYVGQTREVTIPIVVFGLPTQYQNSNGTITQNPPGKAAVTAAKITEFVKNMTYVEFRNTPYFPTEEEVAIFFKQKLAIAMATQRGTSGVRGSGSPNISYRTEQRTNYSNPWNCDQ